MATALETKQAELVEKTNRLAKFFEEKKTPEGFKMTKAETEQVQAQNKEIEDLNVEVKGLVDTEKVYQTNMARLKDLDTPGRPGGYSVKGSLDPKGGRGTDGAWLAPSKKLGDLYIESKGYKERGGSNKFNAEVPDLEVKTLFATTQGWDPFVTRLGRVALSPQQQPKLIDAFPLGTTTQHSIKYMLETTYTNNAGPTAEGALFPESALKLTEEIVPIIKLANYLPVTDEQLADEQQVRDYLNTRLEFMVKQNLDTQLINGNGTAPNLMGLANIAGINTQAQLAGDAMMDTVLRAITLVRTTAFCDPSCVLMNPTDWSKIQLLKTADGLYIWGHPAVSGPSTIWGLPLITSTFITSGTGYVGDFAQQTMLFMRQGLEFATSDSHLDFFQRGQLAIRAMLRCALVCFRPLAVCQMTGLA